MACTVVYCGSVGIDSVGSYGLVSSVHVMCWERRFEVPLQVGTHGDSCKLCGVKPRVLNRLYGLVCEEWAKLLVVRFYVGNLAWSL